MIGTGSAAEWDEIFKKAESATGVPVLLVENDSGDSDGSSFLEAGVPAVLLYSGRNGDYHTPTDTARKIISAGMVRVASVAKAVIDHLVGRPAPLTATVGYRKP